jgi:rod shape-determining protein MreC
MPLHDNRAGRSRSVLAVLVLASATTLTLDHQGGAHSALQPARDVVAQALGPVEEQAAVVARPIAQVPDLFRRNKDLRADLARLQAENATLRGQVATTSDVRHRAAELDALLRTSSRDDLELVPARVVAMGPAQSFTRTVTIDAGTSSGVHPDLTVVNYDGLVGRVVRATATTATVLLVVDEKSVVGARLGSDAEVGFLSGRGDLGGDGRLDLDLVDDSETPGKDDVVVTWGSRGGSPYIAGVPIGRVDSVVASPRDQSKHAVVVPFVDFSSLDLVGVVVRADAQTRAGGAGHAQAGGSRRAVIEGGRLRGSAPTAGAATGGTR